MTAFTAFYDHILPELQGVTPAMVDFALRQTAREFCERSQIHIVDLPAINVVADTASYTLTSNVTGTEVCGVRAVWYDGVPLNVAPMDMLNATVEDWRDQSAETPWAYLLYNETSLTLFPKPTSSLTGGLKVQVALRPTLAATEVVDWIATRWMDALAAGTKARLMMQPAKPWTNLEAAVINRGRFMQGVGDATTNAQRNNTRGTLTVQMRRVF